MSWKKFIGTSLLFVLGTFCLFIFVNSVPFVSSTYYKNISFLPFRIGRISIGLISIFSFFLLLRKFNKSELKKTIKPLFLIAVAFITLESIFTFLPIYTSDHYSPLSKNYLQLNWNENSDGVRDAEMIDYYNPNLPNLLFIGDEFTLGLGLNHEKDRFINKIRTQLSECYNVILIGKHNGNAKMAYEVIQALPFFPTAVIYIHSVDDIIGNTGNLNEIPEIETTQNAINDKSFLIDYLNECRSKKHIDKLEQLKEYYSNKELVSIHKNKLGGIVHFSQQFDYRLGIVTVPLINNSNMLDYSDSVFVKPITDFFTYNATPKLNLTPAIKNLKESKRNIRCNSPLASKPLNDLIADEILNFMVEKSFITTKCIN